MSCKVLPVINTDMVLEYHKHLTNSMPKDKIVVLMTLYLMDRTTPKEIEKAHKTGHIPAAKYYLAGATMNSAAGVTNIKLVYPALRKMAKLGMVLCIHSEVSDLSIDIFDQEEVFIKEVIIPLIADIPNLKMVMEHISAKQAVDYVLASPPNLAATITCHYLLYNRNSLLVGSIKPHFYCLPILKRETHRLALLQAATSGNPKFFLGTDSAPHTISSKQSGCGCAGIFTAHAAVELYTEAFERMDALHKLQNFTSVYGANFYGIPVNEKIILEKRDWVVPDKYVFGDEFVKPLRAGEVVSWSIVE